jgi:hypothetical protein
MIWVTDNANCAVHRHTDGVGNTPWERGKSIKHVTWLSLLWIFGKLEPHAGEKRTAGPRIHRKVGIHHFPDVEVQLEVERGAQDMVDVCSTCDSHLKNSKNKNKYKKDRGTAFYL